MASSLSAGIPQDRVRRLAWTSLLLLKPFYSSQVLVFRCYPCGCLHILNMIRFPPTSIALSESDVEFHLREIQIKAQLYDQGFTQKEVQRYYNECHGRVNDPVEDDLLAFRTTSSVRTNSKKDAPRSISAHPTLEETRKASQTSDGASDVPDDISIRTPSSNDNVKSRQKPTSTAPNHISSSPVSVPSSPPSVTQSSLPYRHAAVRQSSLLRIMHTARSQSSPDSNSSRHDLSQSDAAPDDFLPSPASKIRSYRQRSKTYTYIESEADPPSPPSLSNTEQPSSPPVLQLSRSRPTPSNPHSSPSWLDPEFSSPLVLPPPLSINRRTSSMQFSLPDRTRSSTPLTVNHAVSHPSSPLLPSNSLAILDSFNTTVIDNPLTGSSISPTSPDIAFSLRSETSSAIPGNFPSTPPQTNANPHFSPSFLDSPEASVRVPPRTEPRNPSHRPNGTFGVYNDLLPAATQPQTPADLQSPQRRAVAERNVAYTAPPGQIRTAGRVIGADSNEMEHMEAQTPTARTARMARMRERRAREFARWRDARMESLRSEGGRPDNEVDDDDDTGGVDVNTNGEAMTPELTAQRLGRWDDRQEEAETERAERGLPGEWAQLESSRRQRHAVDWRDEFDEHRVGEENFGLTDLGGVRRRTRTTNTTTGDE
jgi:hypothetical protein